MRVDILTLFPETVYAVLHESIIGRAANKGLLDINCVQIRDYTENKQRQVDDYPYGGGYGCIMMAQPLKSCLDSVTGGKQDPRRRVIYLSPQGKTFTQETAKRLQRDYDHLVLVCGHYEGIDERFIEACVDEEISLGDFVLTGGEIAAMAVTDAVCRLVPGVLSSPECYIGESHWDGLLEYPQYTRPEIWEGRAVPEILLCGDHEKIRRWRRMKQFQRTQKKRPELFEVFNAKNEEDSELLQDMIKSEKRICLKDPLICRHVEEDLPDILQIAEDARRSLLHFHVDQWQGTYPDEASFHREIRRGECFVIFHGEELAAMFTLSCLPEESYDRITDGKWTDGIPYCVMHCAAVADKYRGSDMAEIMLQFVEQECLRFGRRCIRTDTHRKNRPMQRLLRENGFRYRGNILCDDPGGDSRHQAFEKILKEKRR